jgi:3-oxoadipate enol-lactonase
MSTLRVAGADVAYYHDGGGDRTLLLVHGTEGSAEANFGHLVPGLAKSMSVVRLDLPGSGLTTDAGGVVTYDALVEITLAVIDEIGLTSFVVGGFSLGAVLAASVAARKPGSVTGLVAIAGWADSARARTQLQFRLWQQLYGSDRRALAGLLALTGFSPSFLNAMSWQDLESAVADIDFGMPPGISRLAHTNLSVEIRDHLAAVTAPALVVGCTHDAMVPVDEVREFAAALPAAQFRELDSGHLVIYEKADELTQLIVDFVASTPASEPRPAQAS